MGYVDSYNLSFKSHFKTGLLCLIGWIAGNAPFYLERECEWMYNGGLLCIVHDRCHDTSYYRRYIFRL